MKNEPGHITDLKKLYRSPLGRIYVITGAEEYSRRSAVETVLNKAKEAGYEKDNIRKFFGDEVEPDQLQMELSSASLFSEKTVVLIKDAGKMKAVNWSLLSDYAEEPDEDKIVIIEEEKIDLRKKEPQKIKNKADWYNFPQLFENQHLPWLRRYCTKKGYYVSDDALRLIIGTVEPNLQNYVNEFDKILLFTGDKKELYTDDVENILIANKSFKIFDFTHSLADSGKEIIKLLNQIFLFNESVPGILTMITRHLNILLKIKLLANDKSLTKDQISKRSGIPPFRYPQYADQAKKLSLKDFEFLFEEVLKTD
ncbi:DNA polymerase III subunit delta, partial [candidate division KSB1 bacterium]